MPPVAAVSALCALFRARAVRSLEAGLEAEHVLKDEDVLQNATGLEILALSRGLFETALRLNKPRDRQVLFDLAGELEHTLGLDEWIDRAQGEEDPVPQPDESGAAEGDPAD